jgi:hypothetical protein
MELLAFTARLDSGRVTFFSVVGATSAVLAELFESSSMMSLNNKRYLVVHVRGCRSSGSLCFQKTM